MLDTSQIPESDAGSLLLRDTISMGASSATVIGISDRNPETDEITVTLESNTSGNVFYDTFHMLETVYIITSPQTENL